MPGFGSPVSSRLKPGRGPLARQAVSPAGRPPLPGRCSCRNPAGTGQSGSPFELKTAHRKKEWYHEVSALRLFYETKRFLHPIGGPPFRTKKQTILTHHTGGTVGMDSSAYFERLLRYYEGSFDIARPALLGGSEFSALASFHIRQEKYVLVKKATLWGVDSHEHVLMQQYRTAPGPEEVARLGEILTSHMEPEVARRGEANMPEDHMYTYLTLALLSEQPVSEELVKAVQKFKFVKYYSFYLRGYSEARMVLVDLANEKVYTNKAGKKAAELYQRVLADVKAGKA